MHPPGARTREDMKERIMDRTQYTNLAKAWEFTEEHARERESDALTDTRTAADESGQREEFADEAFAPAVEHGDGQCEPDDDVENVHWYAERVVVWDKDSASRAQNQIYLVLPKRRLSKRRLVLRKVVQGEGKNKRSLRFCRGAAAVWKPAVGELPLSVSLFPCGLPRGVRTESRWRGRRCRSR